MRIDRDRAPQIASELRAAAADRSNHAVYADLVRSEHAAGGRLQTVVTMMGCFWSGEARVGSLPGVYKTTPGFQAGREVVRVEFDPTQISAGAIAAPVPDDPLGDADPRAVCRFRPVTDAKRIDPTFHADDQPKFYLQQTELRFIPMTPAQLTRVNAYAHAGLPVEPLLSPGQVALLNEVRQHPTWAWINYVDRPIEN